MGALWAHQPKAIALALMRLLMLDGTVIPAHSQRRKPMAKAKRKTVYRSSKTGKFVTKKYAEKHPNTTEKERVRTGN
jgi:hypothetical protein